MARGIIFDASAEYRTALREFAKLAKPHGAWLALCPGDAWNLVATWHAAKLSDASFEVQRARLLSRMRRSGRAVICTRDQADWAHLPHPVPEGLDLLGCPTAEARPRRLRRNRILG